MIISKKDIYLIILLIPAFLGINYLNFVNDNISVFGGIDYRFNKILFVSLLIQYTMIFFIFHGEGEFFLKKTECFYLIRFRKRNKFIKYLLKRIVNKIVIIQLLSIICYVVMILFFGNQFDYLTILKNTVINSLALMFMIVLQVLLETKYQSRIGLLIMLVTYLVCLVIGTFLYNIDLTVLNTFLIPNQLMSIRFYSNEAEYIMLLIGYLLVMNIMVISILKKTIKNKDII